jgi:hypothetical protein
MRDPKYIHSKLVYTYITCFISSNTVRIITKDDNCRVNQFNMDQEESECNGTCQFLVSADDNNILTEIKFHKESTVILL